MNDLELQEKNGLKKFIISSVLFIITLIIVMSLWISSVSADGGSSLMALFDIDSSKLNTEYVPSGNYSNNKAFFNPYDYGYCVTNYMQDYIGSNDPTTFHPSYAWDSTVEPSDFSGVDIDNNFIICCSNYFSGIGRMTGYILIPKDLFLEGKVCFYRGGYIYATEDFDYTVYSTWTPLTTRTFTADGTSHIIDLQQANSTANCYFCSCPYWDGLGFVGNSTECIQAILDNNNNPFYHDDTLNIFNSNYFMYDDISNMSDAFNTEEVENASNHMYLKDCQIGLTSSQNGSDISASQVSIGIEGDTYMQNHPEEFKIYVNYYMYIKDNYSIVSFPNGVSGSYHQELSVNSFMRNAYSYSVSDIMSKMVTSNNSNFYNYYQTVSGTHNVQVRSDNTYGAYFPTLFGNLDLINIGVYSTTSQAVNNYNISEFYMNVSLQVIPNTSNNDTVSGTYEKKFNFLNGTSSIKNDSIYSNPNPWTGEPSQPEVNPEVPSATGTTGSGNGSGSSAYAHAQNGDVIVNVSNNNSIDNIINGEDTSQDTQNFLDAIAQIKSAFQDMQDEIPDDNNQYNFLAFLKWQLINFPGMDIMLNTIYIVFGVLLIVLVLKMLLF